MLQKMFHAVLAPVLFIGDAPNPDVEWNLGICLVKRSHCKQTGSKRLSVVLRSPCENFSVFYHRFKGIATPKLSTPFWNGVHVRKKPQGSRLVNAFDFGVDVRANVASESGIRNINSVSFESFTIEIGLNEFRSFNFAGTAHPRIDRVNPEHLYKKILNFSTIAIDVFG